MLEQFIRKGYVKVCLATSTLSQGVNLPFKVIWIHSFTAFSSLGSSDSKLIAFKNLIGRAGRTTLDEDVYDYGVVIAKNPHKVIEYIKKPFNISPVSSLEKPIDHIKEDFQELVLSIQNDDFNDDYHLPNDQVNRLKEAPVSEIVENILVAIFEDDKIIKATQYNQLTDDGRKELKKGFEELYAKSIKRELSQGEVALLGNAVHIFLMKIQGRSFKEILRLRYNYLSREKEVKHLENELKSGNINEFEFTNKKKSLTVRFSAPPSSLPNKSLTHFASNYENIAVSKLRYDAVIYETYDYLDKVISFSLTDIFYAAFELHHKESGNSKSKRLADYIRYGTDKPEEILLLRYGFVMDEIDELSPHVESINEDEIIFKDSVINIQQSRILKLVKRYSNH